jgi:NADH-quinone oxidoreductase subunit N
MLSFAGIPLTSGFIGKYLLFSAAIISGTPLTLTILVVAVVTSLISLGYYLPVITALFNFRNTCMLGRKEIASKLLSTPLVKMSLAVIVITVVITLILGILPMPLLDLAKN